MKRGIDRLNSQRQNETNKQLTTELRWCTMVICLPINVSIQLSFILLIELK